MSYLPRDLSRSAARAITRTVWEAARAGDPEAASAMLRQSRRAMGARPYRSTFALCAQMCGMIGEPVGFTTASDATGGEWGSCALLSCLAHAALADGRYAGLSSRASLDALAVYDAAYTREAEGGSFEEQERWVPGHGWISEDECVELRTSEGAPYTHRDDTHVCDDCGATVPADETESVYASSTERETEQLVCEGCAESETYVRVGARFTSRGTDVLVSAASASEVAGYACTELYAVDNTCGCDSCGCRVENDDAQSDDDGNAFCSDCASNRTSGRIKGYHNSAPLALGFFSLSPRTDGIDSYNRARVGGQRYFGFELEMQPAGSARSIAAIADEHLSALAHWTTLEEDGSIPGGCEMITAPHTLDAMRQRLTGTEGAAFSRALKPVKSHNTTACGLHVHVSRTGLHHNTAETLQRFSSAEANQRFLDIVAQRKANSYCQRARSSHDRRCAVNVTNDATIEYRLFKGNTRPDRILKAIEFADALTTYIDGLCRAVGGLAVDVGALSWENLVAWLALDVPAYPALCAYLVERGVAVSVPVPDMLGAPTFVGHDNAARGPVRSYVNDETPSSLLDQRVSDALLCAA